MTYTERRPFAPSPEKVLPEEADNIYARDNANLFVEQVLSEMDKSTYGLGAFIPTPQAILERYQRARNSLSSQPEKLFSLQNLYGAVKRKLFFERELALETFIIHGKVNPIAMTNIGDIHILTTAIELVLLSNQNPDQSPQNATA